MDKWWNVNAIFLSDNQVAIYKPALKNTPRMQDQWKHI